MYVQGVSTRKVAAVLEELCGTSISSTHVSHCAARLDSELESWRSRPLGAFPYVILDARYEKVRHGGRGIDCGSPAHQRTSNALERVNQERKRRPFDCA